MDRTIYLVGFMGSGKSTVGKRLAETLGVPFVDLDDDIEAAAGRSIADIFTADGEAAFRDAEHAALRERARRKDAAVVALGGGAFTFARNRELLQGAGHTVWLDCSYELAHRRVSGFEHRPLAKDPIRFRALYDQRVADYALAEIRIPITTDDPGDAVHLILEALS